jgi:flagellar biosynthesis protein FliR
MGLIVAQVDFYFISYRKNIALELFALLFSTQLLKKQFSNLFAEATDGKGRPTVTFSNWSV